MRRPILIIGLLLALAVTARAQAPEVIPGVTGPAPITPPIPPAAQPSLTPLPPPLPSAEIRAMPRLDPQSIPRGESFSDRVARCVHYGTANGVGAGDIGTFTAQCAN